MRQQIWTWSLAAPASFVPVEQQTLQSKGFQSLLTVTPSKKNILHHIPACTHRHTHNWNQSFMKSLSPLLLYNVPCFLVMVSSMHPSDSSSHIFIHVSLTTATKLHGSFFLISQFLKYYFNNSFFLHHSHSVHCSYGSSPYQWILFSSFKT